MKGNRSLQRLPPPPNLILVTKIIYYSSLKGFGGCLIQPVHFTEDEIRHQKPSHALLKGMLVISIWASEPHFMVPIRAGHKLPSHPGKSLAFHLETPFSLLHVSHSDPCLPQTLLHRTPLPRMCCPEDSGP